MKSLLTKIISMLTTGVLIVSLCACNTTATSGESCGDSHSFVDYSYTAPTCKTNGEKAHKCSHCGFIETETLLSIDHDYQEKITTPSSCTTHGSKTYECTMCHETKIEQLPLTKHDYKLVNTTASTCIIHGSKQFKCNDCNESYSEELPFAAHTYKTEIKGATCFTNGGTFEKCSACGDEKPTSETPLLTHNFGADGYCAKCGIYKTLFDIDKLNVSWAWHSGDHLVILGDLITKFKETPNPMPNSYWEDCIITLTLTLYDENAISLGAVSCESSVQNNGGLIITNASYDSSNIFRIHLAEFYHNFTTEQIQNCKSFKVELSCDGYERIEMSRTM